MSEKDWRKTESVSERKSVLRRLRAQRVRVRNGRTRAESQH